MNTRKMRGDWAQKSLIFIGALLFSLNVADANLTVSAKPHNILFIIMDDVGVDQMTSFGYGGTTPAPMPNMNVIANNGVRFRNNWSSPACSPSRAMFFEGRFPARSNVFNAIGTSDLANSMVSPYNVTTPKLLKKKGYQSGLFGKFHLTTPGNDPYGNAMVSARGWDVFYGFSDDTGDPQSIDVTAGGVGGANGNGISYTCGFIPGANQAGGADSGACYLADGSCTNMSSTNQLYPPGRKCLESGGVLMPNAACSGSVPSNIDFSLMNGHYVSPTIIDRNGVVENLKTTDKRSRAYRSSGPVDEAIKWIKSMPKDTPWMATVSFPSDHTPLVPPPYRLLSTSSQSLDVNGYDCSDTSNQPTLSNQMIEAMDTEIGRLLISTGLAKRNSDGSLIYQPETTNTMIIVVGDNGSLGSVVKTPFDGSRAKGTSYQTGVWTPLFVAGPLVKQPDRDVESMTNIVDVYQLFGEIAGIDVQKTVKWPIDSVGMLPYLKNPNKAAIRKINFAQFDQNIQVDGAINPPCVNSSSSGNSCMNMPPTKGVCNDNGGIWWGPGATDSDDPNHPGPVPLTSCCDVAVWNHDNGGVIPYISPQANLAIRNKDYKNVRTYTRAYDSSNNSCVDKQTNELYKIDQATPTPTLDLNGTDLLVNGVDALTAEQRRNYYALNNKLNSLLNNIIECEGDGNLDGLVDKKDVEGYKLYSKTSGHTTPNGGGLSSWFDFNYDGLTNDQDLQIITDNLGKQCKSGTNANHPNGTALPWVTRY